MTSTYKFCFVIPKERVSLQDQDVDGVFVLKCTLRKYTARMRSDMPTMLMNPRLSTYRGRPVYGRKLITRRQSAGTRLFQAARLSLAPGQGDVWRSGGTAPNVRNFSTTRRRRAVNFTPGRFISEVTDRRQCGTQGGSARCGCEKKSCRSGNRTPILQPVVQSLYMTELQRL